MSEKVLLDSAQAARLISNHPGEQREAGTLKQQGCDIEVRFGTITVFVNNGLVVVKTTYPTCMKDGADAAEFLAPYTHGEEGFVEEVFDAAGEPVYGYAVYENQLSDSLVSI